MNTKTIIVTIVLAMLIATQPARAAVPLPSMFVSYANDNTGTILQGGAWEAFSPSSFSTPGTGDIYRLDPTGFPPTANYTASGFTALYNGQVKMTGKCSQVKSNFVEMRIQFIDGRWQDVVSTSDRVFTFFTFFNAGNFQLLARSPNYAVLKCSILFEAM